MHMFLCYLSSGWWWQNNQAVENGATRVWRAGGTSQHNPWQGLNWHNVPWATGYAHTKQISSHLTGVLYWVLVWVCISATHISQVSNSFIYVTSDCRFTFFVLQGLKEVECLYISSVLILLHMENSWLACWQCYFILSPGEKKCWYDLCGRYPLLSTLQCFIWK